MSLMPEPIKAVPPLASTRLIAPSGAMAKADTDPAPLPVKPKRPSAVTTAQQGAPRCVRSEERRVGKECRSRGAPRLYQEHECVGWKKDGAEENSVQIGEETTQAS